MKRFGIIGDPVSHSMSPRLFTAAYHGRYPYDLIEGACFETSWERFLRDYDGINVTAPFKENAFRAVDRLSPEARRIGAVNLVVKTADGTTTGFNSDYDGVLLAIREAIPVTSGKALVIGCGGAGKAAAAAALDLGYELTLANRNIAHAEQLARSLGSVATDRIPSPSISVIPLAALREAILSADLILYTVPGPLDGYQPEAIRDILTAGGKPCALLEANYRDPVFLPNEPAAGQPMQDGFLYAMAPVPLPVCCTYISGRRWLFHQAAAGYIRFTGEAPDLDALSAALPAK